MKYIKLFVIKMGKDTSYELGSSNKAVVKDRQTL